jgi:hypothetical protein
MKTLTLDRARAIVEHAEAEFGTGEMIEDAFASFARGGAATREEASNALYIVIADFYRMASRHGRGSEAMQEFSKYVGLAGHISLRIIWDVATDPETLDQLARTDHRETVDSFADYLRTLDSADPGFWPAVYQRIGLSFTPEPVFRTSVATGPSNNKPWWRFWR